MSKEAEREQVIVRTSMIGILANIVLVIFKALVGFASGSIAIILDAVNNLTDVLSSVITIIGTKLANRAPDKGHPVGHGRMEYDDDGRRRRHSLRWYHSADGIGKEDPPSRSSELQRRDVGGARRRHRYQADARTLRAPERKNGRVWCA